MLRKRNRLRAGALVLMLSTALPQIVLAQAAAPATPPVERIERGNLVTEGVPEPDAKLAERLSAYINARGASVENWSPDGRGLLIGTRFGETAQLHLVTQPMGARTQLTFAPEPIAKGRFSPRKGSSTLIYQKDIGGNEQFQLFAYDLKSGETRMLTDGRSRHEDFVWSQDGGRIAFTSTKRDGTNTDVYVAALDDVAQARPLVTDGGTFRPVAFSPDDRKLLVGRYISVTKSHLFVVDTATGQKTRIKPELEEAALTGIAFTQDGTGVIFVSDEAGDYLRLGVHDLQKGTTRWISEETGWDVGSVEVSKDGRRIAYTLNEGGYSRLVLLDGRTFKAQRLPDLPKGEISGLAFSPDGSKLAFSLSQPTAPADAYVYDIQDREVTQWTRSEVGGLNTANFAEAELIDYPTFDQVDGKPRRIPAWLFKPKGRNGPLPVVIDIHGGPEAQRTAAFAPNVQFWANELGVAVLRPNVRGSTGYGKTYTSLDNGFNREDAVKDIGALLDWIASRPDLDESRVAVRGGSYGGYMVLASMVHFNDRLRGAVDIVGISDFVTFLESTSGYRRDLRRVEYGDERDPQMRAFLKRVSPLGNASKITKPMLVLQGRNDPRVPYTEAEQIVAQIRRNGGDVWYAMFNDEGHGFRKQTNRFYADLVEAMFLRRVLDLEEG